MSVPGNRLIHPVDFYGHFLLSKVRTLMSQGLPPHRGEGERCQTACTLGRKAGRAKGLLERL
jgi:hypothetical protein